MVDAALDALKGEDKFKGNQVDVRTLMVLYPNRMHVVSVEGRGIDKMSDLKGKRVSTGSPGSATEVMAFRVIEAAGLDKDKDMKRERLGVAESVNAHQGRQDRRLLLGRRPADRGRHRSRRHAGRQDQDGRPLRRGRQDEREVRRHLHQPASSRPRPIRARTRTTRSPSCRTSWSPTPRCRTQVAYDIVKTFIEKRRRTGRGAPRGREHHAREPVAEELADPVASRRDEVSSPRKGVKM